MSNAIIQALEDAHLLRSERGNEIRLLHKGFREALGDPLDADPADRSSHLAAAKAALEAGDPALAERRAAEALRRDGTDTTDACALLGDIALEYARYDRAESRASEADRRYEEAFRRYSLALRQYADIADMNAAARTLAAIGQVLIGQGEFSEAAERLEQARTLRPHDTVIRTELARALWLAGSRSRAMIEIDGVLRDEGDQYTALRTRGEFNADQGRAEDALRDLARVSSGAWPVTRAARALALASLERLAPAEADEQVEAVVHQAPTHGPALFYAARVEALNGDRSAASDLARRAVAAAEPRLSADQRERALKLVNDAAANS